jgi:hypothetical protein
MRSRAWAAAQLSSYVRLFGVGLFEVGLLGVGVVAMHKILPPGVLKRVRLVDLLDLLVGI